MKPTKEQQDNLFELFEGMLVEFNEFEKRFLEQNKVIRGMSPATATPGELHALLTASNYFLLQKIAEVQQVTLALLNTKNKGITNERPNDTTS